MKQYETSLQSIQWKQTLVFEKKNQQKHIVHLNFGMNVRIHFQHEFTTIIFVIIIMQYFFQFTHCVPLPDNEQVQNLYARSICLFFPSGYPIVFPTDQKSFHL